VVAADFGFAAALSMTWWMSTLSQPGASRTGRLASATQPADEELVRRVRRGDQRAFEAIYERYRLPLHRYCHSIVRQREDAEEAFQATMLGAFRSLTAGEEREIALRAWLYRIAHNECVTTLRRRRRQEADELSGLEVSPDDVAGTSELAEDLRQLQADLGRLSEAQRSALVMRELGGLAHAEIARALGREAASVKQLIYQARMSLHALAEGRGLACEAVRRTLSDGDGRALRGRGLKAHVRACTDCREFQEALQTRPVRLTLIAPVLPVALFHEVLRTIVGGAAAPGLLAGGGATAGVGSAGAAALGGGAAATAGAGAAGGIGAKLVAIGAVALIGGTAAGVPAVEAAVRAPASSATRTIPVLVKAAAAPAAPPATAAAGSASTPVSTGARGARARLAPAAAAAAAAPVSAGRPQALPVAPRRAEPGSPDTAGAPGAARRPDIVPAAPAHGPAAHGRPAESGSPAGGAPADRPAAAQAPAPAPVPERRPDHAPVSPAQATAPPATVQPLPVAPGAALPGGPPPGAGATRRR
jgi:RNA polymerase sigma factor (sigma-70 family)